MKNAFDFKNLGIKDKLLVSLKEKLKKEDVLVYLISQKIRGTVLIALTSKKFFVFKSDNKISGITETFFYSDVKSMWKMNEAKSKADLFVDLPDNNLIRFDFQNTFDVDDVIALYKSKSENSPLSGKFKKEALSNKLDHMYRMSKDDIKKLSRTSNLDNNKNDYISVKDPKQNFSSNKPSLWTEKPKVNQNLKDISKSFSKKNQNDVIYDVLPMNSRIDIISDKKMSSETTFSSTYLTNLLSQRNTLLPNGALTLAEKLQNKLDAIEISIIDPNKRMDLSEAIQIGTEVSQLKSRVLQIENLNFYEEILNIKAYSKKEMDSFSDEFDLKLREISSSLKSIQGTDSIYIRISELKNFFNNELEKIRRISSDDRKFLEKTAVSQKELSDEINNIRIDALENREEIFVTQKGWVEIREQISKLSKDIKPNDNQNGDFKHFFRNTIFETNNKILAIDDKGQGAYFNIVDFKDDIVDIIKENETAIYNSIQQKVDKIKSASDEVLTMTSDRFEKIKNWYYEIRDFKDETKEIKRDKFNRIELSVISDAEKLVKLENKYFSFKATSYLLNGTTRYGVRPGMNWSIHDNDGKKGLNSLYISENGESLVFHNYDGIIFQNIKYYFNTPNEFMDSYTFNCQFQAVKYHANMQIDKTFSFIITDNHFMYSVIDINGELINDANPISPMYDLKWITLFKD